MEATPTIATNTHARTHVRTRIHTRADVFSFAPPPSLSLSLFLRWSFDPLTILLERSLTIFLRALHSLLSDALPPSFSLGLSFSPIPLLLSSRRRPPLPSPYLSRYSSLGYNVAASGARSIAPPESCARRTPRLCTGRAGRRDVLCGVCSPPDGLRFADHPFLLLSPPSGLLSIRTIRASAHLIQFAQSAASGPPRVDRLA